MRKDLGTYYVKVEFRNERGFYDRYQTGHRYTLGTEEQSPINADLIRPAWSSEDELIDSIVYMYTKGNYSCDCNRSLFIARAYQEDEPNNVNCGHTIELERLTLIRPDASELVIFDGECGLNSDKGAE